MENCQLSTLNYQLKKMSNTIISVKNLVKNYGNFNAVKDISFDVYEGEIFGLLGPNGAGKSTTLEIMETLRKKTSGEVLIAGLNLDKQPEEIKNLLLVHLPEFQYPLFPALLRFLNHQMAE